MLLKLTSQIVKLIYIISGHPDCWHGSVDIMVNSVILSELVEEDDDDSPGASPVEVKVSDKVHKKDLSQMVAETIVFSFAQKKKHPEYEHYLIPPIGVTKTEIVVHLYDSENDVLMQSYPLPLLSSADTLHTSTVVAIWFVINYIYLCPGINELILKNKIPKADFYLQAGTKLHMYENEFDIGNVHKIASHVAIGHGYFPPIDKLAIVEDA